MDSIWKELAARKLLAHYHLTALVQADQMKDRLSKIDTDRTETLHCGMCSVNKI